MSQALGGTYAWEAANRNRTIGNWLNTHNPDADWIRESGTLAQRAGDLVRNDPVMRALKNAKLSGTHGSKGLIFRSLAEIDGDENTTSDQEDELRKSIEQAVIDASCGVNLDAGGLMNRREFEMALDDLATEAGEAFAIKCWIPQRPGARTGTCWKLLRADRICNPPGSVDSDTLYQGIKTDVNGWPVGVWIGPPQRLGMINDKKAWKFVPWYDEAGERSVIHRIGDRQPGSYRGISKYAANIPLAKQIKGALDAYVVAKRIQACHPIFIKCADPTAAAKADRNGAVWGPNTVLEPGKTYYIGEDGEVSFPTWSFQGADLREFLDTNYRNQFASWGLPIDVVLAQLGETNMAASRSAWMQYYRQCEVWQDDHINQVSSIIDRSIIWEAVAIGNVVLPAGMTLHDAMRGRYIRPPRSMPDPLKEAMAVKAWADLGRDLTGLWAESGVDFRESTIQRAQDNDFLAEYGVVQVTDAPAKTAANADASGATDPNKPEQPADPNAPAPE